MSKELQPPRAALSAPQMAGVEELFPLWFAALVITGVSGTVGNIHALIEPQS